MTNTITGMNSSIALGADPTRKTSEKASHHRAGEKGLLYNVAVRRRRVCGALEHTQRTAKNTKDNNNIGGIDQYEPEEIIPDTQFCTLTSSCGCM
jgi:hypothetical protein